MMSINIKLLVSAFSLIALPATSHASQILSDKCASMWPSPSCLFKGNANDTSKDTSANGFSSVEPAYNFHGNKAPAAGHDQKLDYLFPTQKKADLITGFGSASGVWGIPGHKIDYVAGAGDYFSPHDFGGLGSGNWSAKDFPFGDKPKAISHILFPGEFTSPCAVPEPASWAMLIAGVGMAGGALRRRRNPRLAATAA